MTKKSRISVLTAFHTEPYIALYFKKIYEKYWKDEIDAIYTLVSGSNYMDSASFTQTLWEGIAGFTGYAQDIDDHGKTLNRIYAWLDNEEMRGKLPTSDIIMIIDSDEYIYREGWVEELAGYIERDEADIVASWSQSGSQRLGEVVRNKFMVENHRLNPMIALIRKSFLDRIEDINFSARQFLPKEYIKCIDWTVPQDFPESYGPWKLESMDTCGFLGMQLLALKPRLKIIDMNTEGACLHAGSMSSWATNYAHIPPTYFPDQNFEDRITWWYLQYQLCHKDYPYPSKNEEHIRKLLMFAEANKLSENKLKENMEELFNKYPNLKV